MIPRISAQPPAVDYIDNRLPKRIPTFQNDNIQYDPTSASWVPKPGAPQIMVSTPANSTSNGPQKLVDAKHSTMSFWNSIFGDAMARFNKNYPKRPKDNGYNIRCAANWGDVSAQLDAARHSYLERDGAKAGLTRSRRKAADNVQPAIMALEFVPDIDYVTPVLGAVKILLAAVKVAADTRDKVVHGFDDLDQIFSGIQLFLQTFPDDDRVRETSIDLVVSTFKAVELTIKFFTSSTSRRIMTAVSHGDQYQKELQDSLSEMKACSQQLVQDALGSHMRDTQHAMRKIINRIEPLKKMDEMFAKVHEGQCEIFAKVQEGQCEMFNTMTSLLNEYKKDMRHLRAEIGRMQSRTPSPPPFIVHFINSNDLLDFIGIPTFEEEDMEQILEKKSRLDPEHQIRAESIVQNLRFKNWIVSTASEILLIHGDFREGNQRVSALSLFCTTLTAALRTDQGFVPLVFFCGSHLEDDPCAGGLLMITSLVVQLLSQQNFDLRWLPHELYQDLQSRGNVAALCSLFEWLLFQLPDNVTVFCLIDGAVYYERDQFIDGMSEVLANILDMTTDDSLPVTAKVLVTSPTPTTLVRSPFDVTDSLLSMAAMSSRNWVASQSRLEREMGELSNS